MLFPNMPQYLNTSPLPGNQTICAAGLSSSVDDMKDIACIEVTSNFPPPTSFTHLLTVYITQAEDNNEMQCFPIDSSSEHVQFLKISFPSSSDFYGRITIYKLEIYGTKV